ncbi:MAG TPA: GspH/FimT family protein [Alphaproteobacteria bacterium]
MAQRGFTLIELLVVLVVIGLILAAAPVALRRGAPAIEARVAAGEVAAVLRRARSEAILGNRDVAVAFDTDAGAYALGEDAPWQALPGRVTLSVETARSELRDAHVAGVRFFADGSATGGRITVARDGQSYHVMLDWLTGQVSVIE